jgi:TolA-binding protein
MKYIRLLLLIASFSQLSANNYTSNKQYTYDEVTEILSDKIIETRKRVDEVRYNSVKDHGELEKKINDLTTKVDTLIKNQQIQKSQQPQVKKEVEQVEEKIDKKSVKNTFEEIVIDRDLYEKVK